MTAFNDGTGNLLGSHRLRVNGFSHIERIIDKELLIWLEIPGKLINFRLG